jgi:hypothetical protein
VRDGRWSIGQYSSGGERMRGAGLAASIRKAGFGYTVVGRNAERERQDDRTPTVER